MAKYREDGWNPAWLDVFYDVMNYFGSSIYQNPATGIPAAEMKLHEAPNFNP
jgi:hypothetical protein